MGRRQPRGPETRARILASATHLFTQRGYASVTVDEVAAGAGVTKGAFYHWFTDKADVARDVRHELFDRMTAEALVSLDPEADTLGAMKAGFDRFTGVLVDLDEGRDFLRETWRMTADAQGPFDQEEAVDLVAGMLRAAAQRGEVVDLDPTAAAVLVVGGCSELARHVLETGRREEAVAVLGRLFESLRAAPSDPGPEATATTAVKGPR